MKLFGKEKWLKKIGLIFLTALLVISCGEQSKEQEEVVVEIAQPDAADLPASKPEDNWQESPQWGGRVGYIDNNNILWLQSSTREDDPWFKIAENVAEFQLMDWTFSYRTHSGDLFLVSGPLNSTPSFVDSDVSAFQMLITGRMGYLKQDSSFYVQEKGYEPQKISTNVHAFHLLGDKIGFVAKDGDFWIQHGGTAFGFEKLAENVVDFQIEGEWVALQKKDESGNLELWMATGENNDLQFSKQFEQIETFQMQETFIAGGDVEGVLHLAAIDASGRAKVFTPNITITQAALQEDSIESDLEMELTIPTFKQIKQFDGFYSSIEWAGTQLALTTPDDTLLLAKLDLGGNKVGDLKKVGQVDSYDLVQEGYLTVQFSGEDSISSVLTEKINTTTLKNNNINKVGNISTTELLAGNKLLDSKAVKDAIHYQRSSARPEFLRHAISAELSPIGRSIQGVGKDYNKPSLMFEKTLPAELLQSKLVYKLAPKNHNSYETQSNQTIEKISKKNTSWIPILVGDITIFIPILNPDAPSDPTDPTDPSVPGEIAPFPNVNFPKGMTPFADNYINNYVATHARNDKQNYPYKYTNPSCWRTSSSIKSQCLPGLNLTLIDNYFYNCPLGFSSYAGVLKKTRQDTHSRPALRDKLGQLWVPYTSRHEGRSGYKTAFDGRIYRHILKFNYYQKIVDFRGWKYVEFFGLNMNTLDTCSNVRKTFNGENGRNVMWGEVTPDGYGMVPMDGIQVNERGFIIRLGQYNLPGPKGAPRNSNDTEMRTGDFLEVNLPRQVFVATLGDRLFGGGDGPNCPVFTTCSTISSRAKAIDDNNDGEWDRIVLTGYFSADDIQQNTKDFLASRAMLIGTNNTPNPNVLAVKQWYEREIFRGNINNTILSNFRLEGHSLGAADATVLHHWGVGDKLITYALPFAIPRGAARARAGINTTATHYLSTNDPVAVGAGVFVSAFKEVRRFKNLQAAGATIKECFTSRFDAKVHNRDLYQKCFSSNSFSYY